MKNTDLVSYLPEFLANYQENREALEAENPEFDLAWEAAEQVLKNEFIDTADEYGISRFEKNLGILPSKEDSLETRRSRIKIRWFSELPYTMKMLVFKITECLGGKYNFSVYSKFDVDYLMTLVVFAFDDSQKKELEYILNTMLPANIATDIIYEIVTSEAKIYFGGIIEQADIIELKQR